MKARIAMLADLIEEGWPSMNTVAESLVAGINRHSCSSGHQFACDLIRPSMKRRFSGPNQMAGRQFTLDRVINRFYDYPLHLKRIRSDFEGFHLADHSYGHLLHGLPNE